MTGKISKKFFDENIISRLGSKSENIIVKPENGVDVGVIKSGDNYIIVTTDPFSININFGFEKAAWFAFHILLSDLYTAGIKNGYMSIDLNLPLKITDNEFKIIWDVINRECEKYGISIIAGHTARYSGTDYPMIGGATLFSIGKKYITTKNAGIGDKIILTKSAAMQTALMLLHAFPEYTKSKLDNESINYIENLFYKLTCVDAEILSMDFGINDRVTSMHDCTEGGILNAVYEIGMASGNGIYINADKIRIYEPVKQICDIFTVNPLRSISEGTLLITVKPEYSDDLVSELNKNGIDSDIIGEVMEKSHGIKMEYSGKFMDITPEDDQIWTTLEKYKRMGVK